SAEAIFQVDNYDNFVHVQSEAALRNLATGHPYDAHNDGQMSLRGNTAEVAEQLKSEIQARLEKAGVEVMEARISHLAYAPEIANAMLRRQQASAVIAARSRIVEGAVSMVEMALDELAKRAVVTLDEERKAAMVSNLLVVLCSEHETQPIVTAGTFYRGWGGPVVGERKAFLLRIAPAVLDALQRWASDDLRSLNSQIEFVLRRALQKEGRALGGRNRRPAPRAGGEEAP